MENEPLEITSEGDGDGWVRARNQNGDEGLIPHNYVEVRRPELAGSDHTKRTAYKRVGIAPHLAGHEPQHYFRGSLNCTRNSRGFVTVPEANKYLITLCIFLLKRNKKYNSQLTFGMTFI